MRHRFASGLGFTSEQSSQATELETSQQLECQQPETLAAQEDGKNVLSPGGRTRRAQNPQQTAPDAQ